MFAAVAKVNVDGVRVPWFLTPTMFGVYAWSAVALFILGFIVSVKVGRRGHNPHGKKVLASGRTRGVRWVVTQGAMNSFLGYVYQPVFFLAFRKMFMHHAKIRVHGEGDIVPPRGWVAFDILHTGDWYSKSPYAKKDEDRVWTLDSVVEECRNVARQITGGRALA